MDPSRHRQSPPLRRGWSYTSRTFPTDAPFSYRPLDAGALDGSKLDSGSQEVTANGKGKLEVEVKAPPGTRVKAAGEGLLKDTRVQQETQMQPAPNGYSVPDASRM